MGWLSNRRKRKAVIQQAKNGAAAAREERLRDLRGRHGLPEIVSARLIDPPLAIPGQAGRGRVEAMNRRVGVPPEPLRPVKELVGDLRDLLDELDEDEET
jgi:hypothetical protein